jgi:hypothetical protein
MNLTQKMMRKIKKIGVLSFAKLQAFLGIIIGFILGIIYAFGGLIIDTLVTLDWITSTETPGLSYGSVLAFGALIGMPLIFSCIGFFLGIIEASLYNFSTKWFGGLKLDIQYSNEARS